jgi:plastocyanin
MSRTAPDSRTHRTRKRTLSVVLTGALVGGVGAAAYEFFAPEDSNPVAQRGTEKSDEKDQVAFSTANPGDCVTWKQQGDVTTDFQTVDCAAPHRFEVSTHEDLSQYPTSEFGENSTPPDMDRQEKLTAELCTGPTMDYLKGRLDPQGRYTIAPILPPAAAWAEGDRTMLCGVMAPDADGVAQETTGRVAGSDQSRAAAPDTCERADGDTVSDVPCDQPHSWQVTSVVNLGENFPDAWPTPDDQNKYLNDVCTSAAVRYLGGKGDGSDGDDEGLYRSTLTPFWTTLQQESWDAGSRTVNCAVTKSRSDKDGGGFAELAGDVRNGFTIDGNPPAEQPARNPKR